MSNLLEDFNKRQMTSSIAIPDFRPGDTLRVSLGVSDGMSDRVQTFEGVCIKRRNRLSSSSFTLRKISHNESIQLQVFLYSPVLKSIEVVKYGKVRRAKLYYMLELFGKAARIKDRSEGKREVVKQPLSVS